MNELADEPIFYSPDRIVERILKGEDFSKDNIYNIISNPTRQKIIRYCSKEKRTITEIQKYIGLSYNPTWKHVAQLLDKGLVIGTPGIDKTKGAVVYIETIKPQGILHGRKIK